MMHTLYIPTKASSLMKVWSFPVFGMLASGTLSSILLPLTELLCARSSDSAFSCVTKTLNHIKLFSIYKKFKGKNSYKKRERERENRAQKKFIFSEYLLVFVLYNLCFHLLLVNERNQCLVSKNNHQTFSH